MTERSLPKEILAKLDARAKLRSGGLREKVMDLADADEATRKSTLKSLGLPTRLETALESVFQADAKWARGVTLTVCFYDGDQAARERVLAVASEIFDLAQLSMDAGDPANIRTCDILRPSAIRVGFNTDGYYSYIGTDALSIHPALPTLGLENLHRFPAFSESQKGTIRHEFMHAIGALHEHQHKDANCSDEFDWNTIYEVFPWPKDEIDFNMKPITELDQFAGADIYWGKYDPESIMHYSLQAFLFKDPEHATCLVKENNQLSPSDRDTVKAMYVD